MSAALKGKLEFFSGRGAEYSQLQNFLQNIERRDTCQEY